MKKNTTPAKAKAPKRTPIDLPIEQLMIAPWNPRGEITTDSVADLVPSIKSKGLIQRIAVVKHPKEKDKFIVCAGNRRLVACQLAGMKTVPCELFECSEKEARQMTLLENLKRKDAEPIYVAELIRTLREKDGLSAEEIAAEIGCEVGNQYFGFTAENQECYRRRIKDFRLGKPTWANGWLSAEPLLGPIDLDIGYIAPEDLPFKWIVVGCESGPQRRPCRIEWVEGIVDQAFSRSIPVFVKQLDIDGECVRDIARFPKHLQIRQVPWEVRHG